MQEKFNKKIKKPQINIKDMGVNIDKNEYKEIILSQSNHPDKGFFNNYK